MRLSLAWLGMFIAFLVSNEHFASGGEVRILHCEAEAFATRLAMIQSAQQTIDVASYEIHDDATVGQFFAALLDAQKRGVVIRVLTAGHIGGNAMPKAMMEYLIENGIAIRERPVDERYRLELGRPRLHDKLLIVDRSQLLTGGRNLTQKYFGIGCTHNIDRDILVVGCTAECAAEYFDARWSECKTGQPNLVRDEKAKVAKEQTHPQWNCMPRDQSKAEVAAWLQSSQNAPLAAADTCLCPFEFTPLTVEDCRIEFLRDQVCTKKGQAGNIERRILDSIARARCSIDIETPYFVITNELKHALRNASNRGVRIRILTNSLESTDQVLVQAGYANQRRWLLRNGIELNEFQGRDLLHAKAMVIDSHLAMIGSYNFDVLSERRNSEVAVFIDDKVVSQQLLQSMSVHRSRSQLIDLKGLLLYEIRESDASANKLKEFQRSRWFAPIAKPFL